MSNLVALTLVHVAALFFLPGVRCLKNVVLTVPEAVQARSTIQLSCRYDLEGAPLYSVKFYQGDQEFYRFVPKESPPTRVFPLPGIQVDIYESNNTLVTLRHATKELTGLYKCEVSADAPLFHTLIRSAYLVVTEEPASVPELYAEKTKYSLGERIRANCSSRAGYPAANLTFYINNIQVRNTEMTRLSSYLQEERGGLESSLLELETLALPVMFQEGRLRLGCLASQFSLYRATAEIFLQEDTPQLAHVLGTSLRNPEAGNNEGRCVPSAALLLLAALLAAAR